MPAPPGLFTSAHSSGCNSWSLLMDAVGSFEKRTHRLWNSILPEPGQLSAQLSKLIRVTTCKKTKRTVSQWYRTVYIPWLVTSYDTHKSKCWLNSKPPKPQGTDSRYRTTRARVCLQGLSGFVTLFRYCGCSHDLSLLSYCSWGRRSPSGPGPPG